MLPIIDSHLDLAMNLVYYDRDLRLPLAELNQRERGMIDQPFRGRATVSLPEMRKANIGVCIATLLARSGPGHQPPSRGYGRAELDFRNQMGAEVSARAQLAYYELLHQQGEIRLLRTKPELTAHWTAWNAGSTTAIGVIISMEGADPIADPAELRRWWELGLRAIGPVHYGPGRYGGGTRTDLPLTELGRRLLVAMRELGMVLDVTHLCDRAMAEAFDAWDGPIWASHHNCRALVPWERQLTDDQIRKLARRDAVIGIALDAIMLHPGWVHHVTTPEVVDMTALVRQIDHLAQVTGSVRHIAIGTDLDGGFGCEQTPRDFKSIADLQKLPELLARANYSDADIRAIFHENWLRKLTETLPSD